MWATDGMLRDDGKGDDDDYDDDGWNDKNVVVLVGVVVVVIGCVDDSGGYDDAMIAWVDGGEMVNALHG